MSTSTEILDPSSTTSSEQNTTWLNKCYLAVSGIEKNRIVIFVYIVIVEYMNNKMNTSISELVEFTH